MIVSSGRAIQTKVCVSIPLTGLVRAEWMLARYGQVIPCNWSNAELITWIDTFSPLSFAVDDARNIVVDRVVKEGFEWLVFIDHDVILPPDTFLKFNEYIGVGDIPVVSGWYNAKGNPPEPLLFRGRGNGWYRDWKPGQKVWVDGIPMGCALIHGKLLKAMWNESEEYMVGQTKVRRVFHTPRKTKIDEKTGAVGIYGGTEDLWWCDRVINEKWLKRLKYTKVMNKEFPFLVDTSLKCGHINNDGKIF